MEIFYKNYFVILIDYETAATLPILPFAFYKYNDIIISLADICLKSKLLNDIKIYKNEETVK